jgi:AcrR family transcriptional regulator/DNA-binding MarR family transcriptional regulator
MLGAIVEVARERGVAGVTVAHIVARSGVSRRTFYELFEDREECFLAAFDNALQQASRTVIPAYERQGKWREKVRAGLLAILEFVGDDPGMGSLLIVDALGAGPRVLEHRARGLARLIATVDQGRGEVKGGREPPPLTAEGVVGAVFSVIHARLLESDPGPLTGLLNPLMSMIVLPYLGAGAAAKELTRPTPKPRGRIGGPRKDPLKDLDMRLTYRTVRVLLAIGDRPGESNRQVAARSGIADQGQTSKLLARLEGLGLIHNTGQGPTKGEPNAWTLTPKGEAVEQTIRTQTGN